IAFLVEDGSRRALVDTGAGELFGPGLGGKLPASLVAVGCRPEQVDDILITHVHTDHSGGLVVGGKLGFPNATVHVAREDADLFLDPSNAERAGYIGTISSRPRRRWARVAGTRRSPPFPPDPDPPRDHSDPDPRPPPRQQRLPPRERRGPDRILGRPDPRRPGPVPQALDHNPLRRRPRRGGPPAGGPVRPG